MTVSDVSGFITSSDAKAAVAEGIANLTGIPSEFVDVDLAELDDDRRRLRASMQRRLSSGSLLITYAINVPGDAPAIVTTTGAEVGDALMAASESEIGSAIAASVDTAVGSGAFTLSVTSTSSPSVVVRDTPVVVTTETVTTTATSAQQSLTIVGSIGFLAINPTLETSGSSGLAIVTATYMLAVVIALMSWTL